MTSSPAPPESHRHPPLRRALVGLFLLAWIPRIVLAGTYLGLPLGLDDMYQYDMLALSISRGDGYRWYQREYVEGLRSYFDRYYEADLSPEEVPEDGYLSLFRPPGYPAFLAGIYLISGEARRIAAVRLAQTLLGASLAPLTFLLARRLRMTTRAGAIAGAAVALYPILWAYPLGLGSENLFIPLTMVAVLLLLRSANDPRWTTAALAGAVVGAAALTRGVFSLFGAFAWLWLARRVGWNRAAAFGLAALAVVLPWAVRNSLAAGRPAFVENSIGYNLFVGYHPEGNGGFVSGPALIPTRFLDDVERDRWTFERALEFIRQDPGRAVRLLPLRLGYLSGIETREFTFFYGNNVFGALPSTAVAAIVLGLTIPWIAIAGSAPFGMATSPFAAGRNLILLLVGTTLIAYVPVLAEPRFHLPLVPFLAPYAAWVWADPGVLRRPVSRRAFVLACLALGVLVGLWAWDLHRQAPQITALLSPGGNRLRLPY